ncbi:oxidoreductase [Qipengyuania sp.]|uniref:oxidoreductase n=1 Tax=Qipengyuania sp. TaxID=2004515 RepID=UPI0035C79585
MKRIGVGIVGNGMATRVFHAPYIASMPEFELRAVTSRRESVAPPLPGVTLVASINALLADPAIELIVIATPSGSHASLAKQALQEGRHVVVEKPFTLSVADTQGLLDLASNKGLHAVAFHNRRWDSDFLTIGEAIADGLVGDVLHFESHFDRFRPTIRDRWREDGGPGSGIWFDLGPHLVDQVLSLFGMPLSVSADIAALRPGGTADDWAHVVLEYAGKRIVLHASMCVAGGSPRFAVHGTGGSLIKTLADPQEAQSNAGLRPGDKGWGVDPDSLAWWDAEGETHRRPALRGAQQTFYRQMALACTGKGPPPVSPDEILAVQKVIEAAFLSSQEKRSGSLA